MPLGPRALPSSSLMIRRSETRRCHPPPSCAGATVVLGIGLLEATGQQEGRGGNQRQVRRRERRSYGVRDRLPSYGELGGEGWRSEARLEKGTDLRG